MTNRWKRLRAGLSRWKLPAERVRRAAGSLYLCIAAAFVLWACVFTLWFLFDVLVRDQWHVYVDFFRLPFWQSLWHEQNGHRLVFPNLFYHLDNHAFRGTNIFLQVCILVMNAATGYLLLEGGRPKDVNPLLAKVCGGFVFVLLFWLGNRSDLAWGLSIHYYLPALTAVAACRLLSSVKTDREARESGIVERLKVVLAIVCGMITTFSFGNGMAIWPALAVLCLWRRLRLSHLGAILVSGASAVGLYVMTLPRGSGASTALLLAPWKILIFMGALVGSPIAQALKKQIPLSSDDAIWIPAVVGTVVVLAAAFAGLRQLVRKTPLAPAMAFHLAVVYFVLGNSVVIAFGRLARFGVATAISPRYMIWSLLLWSAAVAAVPRLSVKFRSRWRRAPLLFGTAVASLTVLMIPSHYDGTIELGFASNRATEAGLSLIVGVADEDMVIPWLYSRPEVVREVAAVLRENRWNLFSDSRLDIVKGPPPRAIRAHETLPCLGELTKSELLPGTDGDWRVRGWAWQEQLHAPPQYILFTSGGQVHGLAQFTSGNLATGPPLDIYRQERIYSFLRRFHTLWPSLFRWDLGWYGYVKGAPDLCQLELYGLFSDGQTACALPKPCEGRRDEK